jgi:hypothetical protein
MEWPVNTNHIYKTNPSFINKEDQRKEKKTKVLTLNKYMAMGPYIKQIYGHGSQAGPMPGVSVPAACRQ